MMHAIPGGPFTREKAIPDDKIEVETLQKQYNFTSYSNKNLAILNKFRLLCKNCLYLWMF